LGGVALVSRHGLWGGGLHFIIVSGRSGCAPRPMLRVVAWLLRGAEACRGCFVLVGSRGFRSGGPSVAAGGVYLRTKLVPGGAPVGGGARIVSQCRFVLCW